MWSRDDFHGALKGGYTDYFQTPDASGAYASGNVDGRIDASRDLALDAEGRFNILPEPLSNFGLSTGVNGNPYIQTATWGATVGATQKFGDLSIGLHGAFDQQLYQDVPLYGAGASGLSADDYDDWSLKLKTAYRISEVISPYFEVDVDTRRYANGVDALGYQADSDGASLLAGADVCFLADAERRARARLRAAHLSGPAAAVRLDAADRRLADLVGDAADDIYAEGQYRDQRRDPGRRLRRHQPHLFDRSEPFADAATDC